MRKRSQIDLQKFLQFLLYPVQVSSSIQFKHSLVVSSPQFQYSFQIFSSSIIQYYPSAVPVFIPAVVSSFQFQYSFRSSVPIFVPVLSSSIRSKSSVPVFSSSIQSSVPVFVPNLKFQYYPVLSVLSSSIHSSPQFQYSFQIFSSSSIQSSVPVFIPNLQFQYYPVLYVLSSSIHSSPQFQYSFQFSVPVFTKSSVPLPSFRPSSIQSRPSSIRFQFDFSSSPLNN